MDDFNNNINGNNEQNNNTPVGGFYVPPTQPGEPQRFAPSGNQTPPPQPTPVQAQPQQQQRPPFQPPQPPQRPPVQPPQPQVFVEPQITSPQKSEKPPKKNNALAWIIGLVIVCAIVGVLGVMIASSGNLDKDDSNSSSSSQSQSSSDDEDDNSSNSSNGDAVAEIVGSEEAEKEDSNGNLTVAGVVEKTKSSCVGITVYTQQNSYSYFYNYGSASGSDEKVASGEGSGVIMSESNGKTYIMTCAHVISDGDAFTVTLDNDDEYEAEMVGFDSQTDIGVLVINASGLNVAEFGDSEDIEVGEECIAIGCPGGLTFKNSVTKGIVSALDVPVSSQIGYSTECIQVDAAINPGNSGGALFNMQGQVIGINSSKIASTDYEGMGFAVPSKTAVSTANSLIKNGYVAGRAKIGIEYNTLANYNSASAILDALADKGFKNAEGTMVIQTIESESDLASKNVKQYDMIVAVDGKTLTSTDVMTSALSKKDPGDTVTLSIARIENNSLKIFEVKCKLIESKE
ncbi:MAG: serine protease [Ruminococcaceae bacterium]|nr:serine protease [Oscillospiraceae bacterium]